MQNTKFIYNYLKNKEFKLSISPKTWKLLAI